MSKTNKTAADAPGAEAAAETMIALHNTDKLQYLDMFAEQDTAALKELTGGEFITLEENKTYVFLAVGFERKESKFSQDSDGMTDYAVLLDRSGATKYCSQAVVVSTLKKAQDKLAEGLPIKIVTGEKVVGDKGSYLSMKIYAG